MEKFVSARTRAILNKCVGKYFDQEDKSNDDSAEDICTVYEYSQPCSPVPIKPDLLYTMQTPKNALPLQNKPPKKHDVSAKSSALLTPARLSSYDVNINSDETTAEKSIEAPPYSPLTPRPFPAKHSNNGLMDNAKPHIVNRTTENVEPPPISPFSPLPPMSPGTSQQFNLFYQSVMNEVAETPSSVRNDFYSDDSEQDPNFVPDYQSDTTCCSSSSSDNSISILTPKEDELNDADATTDMANLDSNVEAISSQQTSSAPNLTEPDGECCGRPKKGRKRLYGGLTREERKRRKYMNLSYVNSRKKRIDPKPFLDFKCGCPKKCDEMVSVEKREAAFKKFYALDTYEGQNMYLVSCVKENPVKRRYKSNLTEAGNKKKKNYSRSYFIGTQIVCRQMFVKTLQTTPKRINTALSKMKSDCITDKRGKQGGHNRVSPESEQFVINVIKKLPTYVSHYRREQYKNVKFLRPDVTMHKIYDIYCDEAKAAGIRVISFEKVKKIFLTKFNLRTKPLKKDTCNKCDYFANKKMHASEEEKAKIEESHNAHLAKAESLRNQLKQDLEYAKDDPSTETITFDLEKTLPLPRIPTNVVFYKRQLWVYNFGIHTGKHGETQCNVWVEGEAGRGAQEVGSCLIKYVFERLGENITKLILWSDSCGGQNRNIKLTLMLKAMLNDHPTLDQINLRFLESGHSFLPNDADFSKIETALKHYQRIYSPEDYMEVMKSCKRYKPYLVNRMKKEDFLSSSKLEKNITNRKKAVDGSKVSWLQTKEIMLKKDKMFTIFIRSDMCEEFQEVDIAKRGKQLNFQLSRDIMEPLWPNGKPIPAQKLNDLKSLLQFIPQDLHQFYNNLVGDNNIEDDIDGFSGAPDFDLEHDDEVVE